MVDLEEKCVSKLKEMLKTNEKSLEKTSSKFKSASNMLTKERKKTRLLESEIRQLQTWLVETGKFGRVRDGKRYYVEKLNGDNQSTSQFNFKEFHDSIGDEFDPEMLDYLNEEPTCSKSSDNHVPIDVNPFAEASTTEDIVKKLEESAKETVKIEVISVPEIDDLRRTLDEKNEELKRLTEENRMLNLQLSNTTMEKNKVKEMQERHDDEWKFKYQSLEIEMKLIKERIITERAKCRNLEILLSGNPRMHSVLAEIRQEEKSMIEKAKLLQVTLEMSRTEKGKRKSYREIMPSMLPKYAIDTLQKCDSLVGLLDAKIFKEEIKTAEMERTIVELVAENEALKSQGRLQKSES